MWVWSTVTVVLYWDEVRRPIQSPFRIVLQTVLVDKVAVSIVLVFPHYVSEVL